MSIKIIIVDDSENFRNLIHKILQKIENFEVVGIACDGEEAIKAADSLSPDMVLLDIRMPGMDGIKTLEILKKSHPDLKVIMITNHELYEYQWVTKEKGAEGFILKKDLFRELIPHIQSLFTH